jgi:uncharacterized membrane protein
MFGLVLGTLCLIALVATVRRRRYGRFARAHWHGRAPWVGPYAGFEGWSRRSYAITMPPGLRRGGWLVRALFERLDTSHGQEKALVQIAAQVRERLHGTRDELHAARKDLAAAVGGDVIDGTALDSAVARHKALFDKLGKELTQTLLSVHEVLDGEQRALLAQMIANGPMVGGWRGVGRHAF